MPPYDTNRLLERTRAMLAQTAAQGSTPFAGSSYDTGSLESMATPPPQQPPNPAIGGSSVNTEPSNQSQQLGLALMEMLNKAKGLGTGGFQQQKFNAQDEQNRRFAFTAPGLIGASPSVQSSARNAEAGAVQPTITGAEQGAKTFQEQLGTFKEGIRDYQQVLRDEESRQDRERDDARTLVNQALTTFGSKGFDVLDPKYLKLAGYDQKTISLAKDTLKERELAEKQKDPDLQFVPGTEHQPGGYFNKRTGEFISIGGGAGTNGKPSYSAEQARRTLAGIATVTKKLNEGTLVLGRDAAFQEQLNPVLQSDNYRNTVALVQQIKSSISLGELAAMREASKTGGALGNVSDAEGRRLESAIGNLDLNQTPEQFKLTLQEITNSINNWNAAVRQQGGVSGAGESTDGTVRMSGPQGSFDVPADQVTTFEQNGYQRI